MVNKAEFKNWLRKEQIESTRRIIEAAYLQAWGKEGSADARDEFKKNIVQCEFPEEIGDFLYCGNGEFKWSTGRTEFGVIA